MTDILQHSEHDDDKQPVVGQEPKPAIDPGGPEPAQHDKHDDDVQNAEKQGEPWRY